MKTERLRKREIQGERKERNYYEIINNSHCDGKVSITE